MAVNAAEGERPPLDQLHQLRQGPLVLRVTHIYTRLAYVEVPGDHLQRLEEVIVASEAMLAQQLIQLLPVLIAEPFPAYVVPSPGRFTSNT